MSKRRRRRGEIAIRFAARRATRDSSELSAPLAEIIADDDKLALAGIALEDEGGLLRNILRWIVDNPEQFKELILWIIGLFADEEES